MICSVIQYISHTLQVHSLVNKTLWVTDLLLSRCNITTSWSDLVWVKFNKKRAIRSQWKQFKPGHITESLFTCNTSTHPRTHCQTQLYPHLWFPTNKEMLCPNPFAGNMRMSYSRVAKSMVLYLQPNISFTLQQMVILLTQSY